MDTQRMLVILRMKLNEENKKLCAMRKELQSIIGEGLVWQNMEGAGDRLLRMIQYLK